MTSEQAERRLVELGFHPVTMWKPYYESIEFRDYDLGLRVFRGTYTASGGMDAEFSNDGVVANAENIRRRLDFQATMEYCS